MSLADLAKTINAGWNEGSLKWYEIPRSQDNLNAIITRAPREMFNQNCDLLTVYAYLKDHKADTLDSVVKVVEGFAARHGSDELRILNAAGNAGIEAATNIVVKKANVEMLGLVYLAVIALLPATTTFLLLDSWVAAQWSTDFGFAVWPAACCGGTSELMGWLSRGVHST